MKKVLHVFATLNRGGSETAIMNYYRNIDRTRVQFGFAVHTESECAYEREILDMGGELFRLPRFTGKNIVGYTGAWKRLLAEHPEYGAVHSHFYTVAGIQLDMAKKTGVPVRICSCHTFLKDLTPAQKLTFELMKRMTFRSATHLFACSESAGRWMYGDREFMVLRNAIDPSRFSFDPRKREKVRAGLGLDGRVTLGHVGRFEPMKNHAFLLEVFRLFHKNRPDSALLLVGDGPLRKASEEKAAELGLSDSVIFTGSRGDVPELLQAMDVLVFPSTYEGLPVSLVEAQAASLPCLVSDAVSEEARITGFLERFSLSRGAQVWAEKLRELTAAPVERRDMSAEITSAGYDIREKAKWLEDFYCRECR